jgi:hypothetical protein
LDVVRKHLQASDPTQIVVSLPAIVFSTLRLVWRVRELDFPEPLVVVNGIPEEAENAADLNNQETAGVDEPEQIVTKNENQTSEDDIGSSDRKEGHTPQLLSKPHRKLNY